MSYIARLYANLFLIIVSMSLSVFPLVLSAQDRNVERNTAQVVVSQEGSAWTIAGQKVRVTLNEENWRMEVRAGISAWSMIPAATDDLIIKSATAIFPVSLADAGQKKVEYYRTGYLSGVKISLSDFKRVVSDPSEALDFDLQLFIGLQGRDEDLVCRIVPREGRDNIRQLFWPKGFETGSYDTTVVPFMQGMLLPKDWPQAVRLYDTDSYGRGLYMPWWGHQHGEAAALAMMETPEDGGCRFSHPAGGPTRMELRWNHSLGQLRYPRQVRFCFFEKGNYVALAKRYRQHVKETGHFVSLREKIARSPLVEKMIGTPVVHTGILYHIQPDSSYYDAKDPAKNHQLVTFDHSAQNLRKLAEQGVRRAYVHLDGWGRRGYDNLHPDAIPPNEEAGGWEGMKRFSDTCDELNFIFAIHDQYRDYYLDADSYDPRHTIIDSEGRRPSGSTWYGGKQSILCSSLAPGHVEKNHRALLEHGIKLRGAYLDVFAVVPPDECYNPEHPVTRAECLRYRGHCLDWVRQNLGVVSSEEPADWAIPHLDLVHHGPYALDPNPGHGPAMGIPVPLFNLVYHDAILLPWSLERGPWGIPEQDLGFLHGMLNAGLPYLGFSPSLENKKQMQAMCALHERVGLMEMTKHETLDVKGRRQRTAYADGTTVTVDLDADTYEVSPPLSNEPTAFWAGKN